MSGGGTDLDLNSLTIPLLKDELRQRGLKVSGKKAELIQRLREAGAGSGGAPVPAKKVQPAGPNKMAAAGGPSVDIIACKS